MCFLSCFSTECQMWTSVKCLLDSVSMGSASTHRAPFSANALQEWLLMSAAGHALVCTAHVLVPIPSQSPVCWCISLQRASWYLPLIFKKNKQTMCPMASRPAYWAVLPDPWGWALWDAHQWQAPRGRLLLLSGCSLGPWVWRVSWKGQPRVHPAVPSWPRLLS